jgi:DNA-binding transcriptional MerR regulator
MNIQAFAERCGLTAHTLRYYERIGLLGAVARRDNGHREFGPRDVAWVEVLQRLRETGMPIREMLRYAELRHAGEGTLEERRAMLAAHADALEATLQRQRSHLAFVRRKIANYDEQIAQAPRRRRA